MPRCYQCGHLIAKLATPYRRTVKTGEWLRRRYVGGGLSMRQTHYGRRVLCQWCARNHDRREARAQWLQLAKIALLLLVLFIALLVGPF